MPAGGVLTPGPERARAGAVGTRTGLAARQERAEGDALLILTPLAEPAEQL